jgi:hypothetical protein
MAAQDVDHGKPFTEDNVREGPLRTIGQLRLLPVCSAAVDPSMGTDQRSIRLEVCWKGSKIIPRALVEKSSL